MTLHELNESFALPGVLAFDAGTGGLPRALITTPACTAELYLHGAHLTAWQPAGHAPAIFLSDRSPFAADKPIRGGVPIIFPWFGPRTATPASDRTDGPAHGFARTSPWELTFAALAGDDLHLALTLGPSELSRSLGYDDFRLGFELTLGRELRMRLTVANLGTAPLYFEEALHTYLAVGDATQLAIAGLAQADFIDKTDSFTRKRQPADPLHLTATTDSLYLNTTAEVTLTDPVLHRRLHIAKANSRSTVVWNPWSTLSVKMDDLTPEGWRTMACIETANAADNRLALAPGEAHTMESHIRIEELPAS